MAAFLIYSIGGSIGAGALVALAVGNVRSLRAHGVARLTSTGRSLP